jgi:gamma-glutamylcyclotransferase (GGCT)/AIG2-like uncharacterized protein YtfP
MACKRAGLSKDTYYRWRTANIRHVFFYGSLRQGEEGYVELALDTYLSFFAKDSIEGKLYDLGPYPGMKPVKANETAVTHGELYSIEDDRVLPILDKFERYVPKGRSLYLRKGVRTLEHKVHAWAYIIVGKVERKPLIPQGDWLRYKSGVQLA